MKKSILYIIPMALMLATSCEDALELYPLDKPSAEIFYTNETELQGAVNACYGFLTKPERNYFHPAYSYDGMSDLIFIRGGFGFEKNTMASSLDYTYFWFRTLWLTNYQGVARCNLVLQKIEENSDQLSDEVKDQLMGEALALRGFYYLRLINMFGDVVYLDEPVASVDEASTVSRTPKAEVLQEIYADFDQAASLLAGSEVNELGRITSGAAMALKARAALHNNDWATAAAAAKTVIDSDQYSIMPSYETLFNKEVINDPGNTEEILSIGALVEANNAHWFTQYCGTRLLGGWSTIVPTQNMLDSYLCTDGEDISQSPLYDKANPYENRDPRMRFSYVLPGDMWGDVVYDTRLDKPMTIDINGDSVTNRDSYATTEFTSFTGYVLRKYYDFDYTGAFRRQGENPFYLCRYAEVLLTFAEAKIELNQIDGECLDAINQVRQRADVMMPEVTALSQDEMRRIIRSERKVELFSENLRYQDLLRWRRAHVVLSRPILGRPVLGDPDVYPDVTFDEFGDPVYDVDSYEPHPSTDYRVLLLNGNFQERDYVWPIPEQELSLNPALGQNDGW